jgi:hypothetical protein
VAGEFIVSALIMTKITKISMKNENDALLFGTHIKHDRKNIYKRIVVIT